jgi:ABC-2 type transport system permease protein
MSSSTGGQFRRLMRRAITRTLRQPALIVPSFVFPLFMLAVVSAGGSDVTSIEGFPTDSYITFMLGAMMVQGASGAATMAGTTLGNDIGTGFLSRLALTPMTATKLIAANLSGVAVIGVVQAAIYLGVGLAAGAYVEAGVGGAVALIGVCLLMILAFGAIGSLAAVMAGSGEQIQGLVAVVLALLFMSSMLMPRNLIEESWFETIATYNPLSYLVEANRSLLITGWDAEGLALGCGLAGVLAILAVGATVLRLKRTMV